MEEKHLINFFDKNCIVKYKVGNSPKYLSVEGKLLKDEDGVIIEDKNSITKVLFKHIRGVRLK